MHIRPAIQAGIFALVLGAASGLAGDARTWVRADGRRLTAELVGSSGDRVVLAIPNGVRISMAAADLCEEDQARIRALAEGRTPPPETPPEARAARALAQDRTAAARPATPAAPVVASALPAARMAPADAVRPAPTPLPSVTPAALRPPSALPRSASQLWGANGEAWTPASRLPDFSFAGYRQGEQAIPDIPVVTDVKKHGAKGDGRTDDTEAFRAAVAATPKGAILVPAGRYVLTSEITLQRGRVVLRGEGPERSVLVCPRSLAQVHGASVVDGSKSKWAFSGGFVTMKGGARTAKAAGVTEPARRGDRTVTLSDASAFRAGDYIRLTLNNAASLGRYIHGDRFDAGEATFKEKRNFMDWVARVTAVEGRRVTFDRPLRLDLRAEWEPQAWTWVPEAEDMGVEHLAFEFPGVPKKPHLQEEGFNAIQMTGVVNGWVRDVTVMDCDCGVILGNCRFCRIEDTRFTNPRRANPSGHHALWATSSAQDCLFTKFDIATRFVHDLTVEGTATGNVFSDGRAEQLTCDHHCNAPYENLFTDLEAGDPSRLYVCGGRGDRGPHTGIHTTFWNIRGRGTFAKPPDWPKINLIAVGDYRESMKDEGPWIEPVRNIAPADLHQAQQARRIRTARP